MAKKKKNFGEQFLIDFADAELEFYWSIDTKIMLPKNKVLTGLTQSLQQIISLRLFVGGFKDGIISISNLSRSIYRDICERSADEIVMHDNHGNSYTGSQFLSILILCEVQ